MIRLEKIKNSSVQRYFYHPENTADVGMIEIKENEVVIAVQVNRDKEFGAPYYANKARAEVLRLLKTSNLVESKLFVFYPALSA
ncbi:hypothetical protein [Streptococcus sp. sy004]|uniref:hypothetical protein n=1 Tax=Streptococcus sp. sy004 TaxID=2600149 RepID=UPI0011B5089F|nr:hypothetical protein [Streptococcus sp. sy004]TWT11269.1 hypothetical protein FRX54_03205 [Streptococcus sp. sy004]